MPLWHAISYGTLITAALLMLSDTTLPPAQHVLGLILSGIWGFWYWFMIIHHQHWVRQPRPMLIYMAGALIISLILLRLHTAYFVISYSLYGQLFGLLPLGWAVIGAVFLSIALFLEQTVLTGKTIAADPSLVLTYLGLAATAILLGLWISAIIRESRERKQLLEKIAATQRDLALAERQAGMLEERQRLAREIHDTLAQDIASLVMHLEAADQALSVDTAAAQRHIDHARRTARESLSEARRFVWALRPESLEDDLLPNALKRVLESWSEASGIAARATITGVPRPLLPECEVTLLRVTQQALANTRKHAQAREVVLTLSYMDDTVALDIQDDGIGFDPQGLAAQPEGNGFGLAAMRQRVEQLGGELSIESAPREGTILVVELPIAVTSLGAATRKAN